VFGPEFAILRIPLPKNKMKNKLKKAVQLSLLLSTDCTSSFPGCLLFLYSGVRERERAGRKDNLGEDAD